jgi:hypothetical protein
VAVKDNVFTRGTRLEFPDPGLGGWQVPNDFNPIEMHAIYLLQEVEGGFHGHLFAEKPANGALEGTFYGSRVLRANMGCKLLFALPLVVPLQFLER